MRNYSVGDYRKVIATPETNLVPSLMGLVYLWRDALLLSALDDSLKVVFQDTKLIGAYIPFDRFQTVLSRRDKFRFLQKMLTRIG